MNKVRLFAIVNNVYQEFIDGPFQDHYTREVVATFDNEELAKEYIKKSKLKKPIRRTYCSTKTFKRKSLLWIAEYAEIEPINDTETIPHNPTL